MRDVARRAGVSAAAVSYVLNGRSDEVSEATRRRVLEAVEELGYRPNALARFLAGRPTRSLGLVWTEDGAGPGEEGLPAFLAGLGETLRTSGYTVTLGGGVASGELGKRVEELLSRQVDGLLVLAGAFPEDRRLRERLARAGCPIVFCGAFPEGVTAARVDLDQREGMRLAAAHLLGLGHRKLAYLDAAAEWPYRLRREGFAAAMAGADPAPEVMFAVTDGSEASGYHVGEQLLAGERPTAFICANDALALGLLRAAWRHGVAIPEEVAVVGFGDSPAAAYTIPTLTTVRGSLQAVGATAAQVLVEAATAGTVAQGIHLIPPKLVVRESCGSHLWL